ncbi:hypothetical protein [Oceaniglobus trochenteri]|uniref:hypothetical protein n=1 Tax=Oceaniglobus trochenteri TaxID=2763260 RepID=UPI001CFF9C1F|nr:hypothetical protein [Oceaniglobus trochenteri]
MSAAEIAADVLAGLQEAGSETGDGTPAMAVIIRAGTPTGPSYNQSPGTPSEHSCTVVYSRWDARQIDGTLIKADDQRLLVGVPDLAIVPQVGDRFRGADGVEREIVPPLSHVSPGGGAVLYVLNVRG